MDCLAIIAYRQPISRYQIEAIRGVDSSGVLKNLLGKNLVKIKGRDSGPGRPLLYKTTDVFLEYFGSISAVYLQYSRSIPRIFL